MTAKRSKNEIVRKAIHLGCLVFPMMYTFFSREVMLFILGTLLLVAFCVEWARFHWDWFARWFYGLTADLLREHEHSRLTGSTHLFIGSFLAVLLFEKWIALMVLLFLIVADTAGALVGRLWGKYRLSGEKTVEGSLMFVITAVAIVLLVPGANWIIGLVGVGVAFVVEVFLRRIDDNLTIPLGAGSVMQVLAWIALK